MLKKMLAFATICLSIMSLHGQIRRGFTTPSDTDFVITSVINTTRNLAYIFPLTKKTFGHIINSGETLKPIREQSAESTESSLPGIEDQDSLIVISFTKQYLLMRTGDKFFVSDLTGFDKLPADHKPGNLIEQTNIRDTKNITIIINQDGTLKLE